MRTPAAEFMPVPAGLMPPSIEAHQAVGWSRRAIAAGVAVLSMVGSLPEARASAPAPQEISFSTPIQQQIAYQNLSRDLKAWPPKIAEARQAGSDVANGDPALTAVVNRTISLAAAETLLRNPDRSATTESLKNIDATLGDYFGATAALTPTVRAELQPYANPQQKIDLSDVKAKTLIPNSCKVMELTEHCGRAAYQQFGEITAVDGKLQMAFQEGGGMTPTLHAQFQAAFEHNQPLLEAAFASGELVTVRFIVSGMGFDPGYRAESRELFMILPKDDSITIETLATTMTHETLHALTRNLFQEIGVSNDELRQLANICNELRRSVYEDFEDKLYLHPEWLEALHEQAKPEHQPLIDRVRKAVQDGDLEEILAHTPAQLAAEPLSALANQCANTDENNNSLSDHDLLLKARDEAQSQATAEELAYLFDSDAYKALSHNWVTVLRRGSIYSKVIDEANYVDAGEGGHSADIAPEALASALDDAFNYRAKFGLDNLNYSGTADARRAVIDMEIFGLTYLADRHPNLKPYCMQLIEYYNSLRA